MGATASAKQHYTYADYEKLPEGAPYQLIGGELVMTPALTPYHQRILRKIGYAFVNFVEPRGLGEILYAPIDVFLSDTEAYQPDIIFISKERAGIIGEKKIEGAPDLVVEILSPATAYYDLRLKMRVYESSGVKEYWVIDPVERTAEVYENMGREFRISGKARETGSVRSKLLPGFDIDLATIF